tara:strand:+ start:3788 stop:4291 length:504 start_codon:yes stop_codon:yes gene_type:complete
MLQFTSRTCHTGFASLLKGTIVLKNNSLINIAGFIWVLVGSFLIYRGVVLYGLAAAEQQSTQNAIMISIITGLVIGLIKGRFVLSKTARRNRARIESLEQPVKIYQIFAPPFYGLIAGMILFGVFLRNQNEMFGGYIVVATIYCGIGAALIISSLVYWKNESGPIKV